MSIFFDTFIGEYVEVLTKIITTKREETEDRLIQSNKPIILQGYMLDMDKEYYYLGNASDNIVSAIRKDEVVYVEIVDKKDELDLKLDDMDTSSVQ